VHHGLRGVRCGEASQLGAQVVPRDEVPVDDDDPLVGLQLRAGVPEAAAGAARLTLVERADREPQLGTGRLDDRVEVGGPVRRGERDVRDPGRCQPPQLVQDDRLAGQW